MPARVNLALTMGGGPQSQSIAALSPKNNSLTGNSRNPPLKRQVAPTA
jgi:hypothetical protein